MAHISLLGCGTWGSTLAQVLGQNGHTVTAWHYKAEVVDEMARSRMHPNITDFEFHSNIIFKKETGLQSDIIPKHTIYLMNKKVCYITWILFQDELLKNITQKRNSKNINFWYLCYNVGLYLGYYSYKIPTVKESQILYCDREANNNMKRRLINEVKMLFKNKPIVFCFNNMNEECIHLWNFIRKKYIKWNKKI